MDTNVAWALLVLLLGAGFHVAALYMSKPKNFFTALTPGGEEKRVRMKNANDVFDWKDPADGRHVRFVLDPAFSRVGKRGLRYMGDTATGLLIRWDHVSKKWMEQDPKYLYAALADGREENLANANKPGLERFIPLILGLGAMTLVAALVGLFFMYKLQQGAGR